MRFPRPTAPPATRLSLALSLALTGVVSACGASGARGGSDAASPTGGGAGGDGGSDSSAGSGGGGGDGGVAGQGGVPARDAGPSGDATAGGALSDARPPDADGTVGGTARTDAATMTPDGGLPPAGVCSGTYARPTEAGVMEDDRLDEVSGLSPSPTAPDVLWMLNDSGDLSRVYAVTKTGRLLGILFLRGVENVDFEDIAAGPCPVWGPAGPPAGFPNGPGAKCLWIADTGNNGGDRSEFVIHVTPEPTVDPVDGFADVAAENIAHFRVRYPDAIRDSEALALAPDGSTFYLFEKVDGAPSHVYRHPGAFVDGETAELLPVATINAPGFDIPLGHMITGAAMHPGGRRLLLRVYTGSYEYRLPDGGDWSGLADIEPLRVAAGPLTEPQGEAISYDSAGTGVFTISEDTDETGRVPLHHYECVP